MSILYLLIPLSLILLALAVWAFFWAVDNKQFDDLEGPAYSILFDDDDPRHTGKKNTQNDSSSQQTANASAVTPTATPVAPSKETGSAESSSSAPSAVSTPQSSAHNSGTSQSPTNSAPSQRSSHD